MSIKIRLADHNYGAKGIRLLRIDRHQPQNAFEVELDIRLEGAHLKAFQEGDTSCLQSTGDLAEQARQVAADQAGCSLEELGLAIGRHFVQTLKPGTRAALELAERRWLAVGESDKAFRAVGGERHTARVIVDGGGIRVRSGLLELGLLQAGRLDEAALLCGDRLRAVWDYRLTEVDYEAHREMVREQLLGNFADHESPSAHQMLWRMGCGVLSAVDAVWRIHLVLPQVSCRPWEPDAESSDRVYFVPSSEPAGRIDITLERT